MTLPRQPTKPHLTSAVFLSSDQRMGSTTLLEAGIATELIAAVHKK